MPSDMSIYPLQYAKQGSVTDVTAAQSLEKGESVSSLSFKAPVLTPDVAAAVMNHVDDLQKSQKAAAPSLEQPIPVKTSAADASSALQKNMTILTTDEALQLLDSVAIIQDPANTDPSVQAGREILGQTGANIYNLMKSSDPSQMATSLLDIVDQNDFENVDPETGMMTLNDGSTVNANSFRSVIGLLSYFLAKLPSVIAESTGNQIQALSKQATAVLNQIKSDIKEQQKEQADMAAQQAAAASSSSSSSIFGWVAASLEIVVGLALVATGIGGVAGAGLLIAGTLSMANQIMNATGLYDKYPGLQTFMSYAIPAVQLAVSVATFGAGSGLVAAGALISAVGSGVQITDQALVDTGEIEDGSTADNVLNYGGMGLQLAGSFTMVGGAVKGAGSAATAVEDIAEAGEEGAKAGSKSANVLEDADEEFDGVADLSALYGEAEEEWELADVAADVATETAKSTASASQAASSASSAGSSGSSAASSASSATGSSTGTSDVSGATDTAGQTATTMEKVGTGVAAGGEVLEGGAQIASGAFAIKTGLAQLQINQLQELYAKITAQIQLDQSQVTFYQDLESKIADAFKEILGQDQVMSQSMFTLLNTQGQITTSIASNIGATSTSV